MTWLNKVKSILIGYLATHDDDYIVTHDGKKILAFDRRWQPFSRAATSMTNRAKAAAAVFTNKSKA